MNPQLSAREALFIESLGEMAAVVNRVEALVPLLQDTRQSLIDANAQLASQLRDFEDRTTLISENARLVAVKHIARHTEKMTRSAIHRQVQEIHEAARTAMGEQIRPTLQAMIAPLQRLAQLAAQRERPWAHWQRWLTHAATAAVAAWVTLGMTAWLWPR